MNALETPIGTVWARLPGPGKDIEGLRRGVLYLLIREGKIRSKTLSPTGRERGIRLIHVPSVREYIERVGREEVPTEAIANN